MCREIFRLLSGVTVSVVLLLFVGCGSSRPAVNLDRPVESLSVDAQTTMVGADVSALTMAIHLYHADTAVLPTEKQGFRVLMRNPGVAGWRGPYVTNVPRDPWGRAYVYRLDGTVFTVLSPGPDGQAGTGDDLSAD